MVCRASSSVKLLFMMSSAERQTSLGCQQVMCVTTARSPELVGLDNSVRLPVELVTNRKLAKAVREEITMKSFDFPDLIADIDGLCCFAHLTRTLLSVCYGRHSPSAVPSGLASTTL